LVITDAAGRLLCCGQTRPDAIHDLTQVRQAGLGELLALVPGRDPAGRRRLSGAECPDRRRGAHSAAGPAEEPDPGLSRRRRGARGRTPGSRGAAHPRRARHQPPERTAEPWLVTSADAITPTQSCAPWPDWYPARNEPHDLTSFTAHRTLYRPALPGNRTRPEQANDRSPRTMQEVVTTVLSWSATGQ
jgi:hypothetical protein